MTRAYPISTADQAPSTRTARMGNGIAKAWRGYWQRRAKRATVELLHSLDDRTLHDIGVSRNEIPSLVYGRHGDRTRCYQGSWRLWHASR
jgi:uncharacterized protein YjiS (DUF1127 family)